MATKRVQVLDAGEVYEQMDYGYVPPSITERLRNAGKNAILIRNDPQMVTMMAMQHAHVLTLDDLSLDEAEMKQLRRELAIGGFKISADDGTIHKSDCVLVAQPEAARQHFHEVNEETWRNQEYSSEQGAEAIQEDFLEKIPKGFGRISGAQTAGGLRGHYGRPPNAPR